MTKPIFKNNGEILEKHTKQQVEALIRRNQTFDGYLVGNKVNPHHINDGWHLGYRTTITTLEDLKLTIDTFTTGLMIAGYGLGKYPHFYQIVKEKQNEI